MTDTRADPSNCSLFFDCDVHKSCPNGFLFDSECGFCDVARKVNCSIKQDLTI
uniref:Chitin-binding type-2 domain-containing protein n=1 Tax=Romanomermis culicivorax TaxID=13658 RepID=A0A915JMK6_ROMCU